MPSRVRWVLIFWMFAISAIAYLDRVNISIAGHFIQQEYHISNVELGWIFSAFVLGYAAFQAPGGRLADRFGPRRLIAWGTVWWGVFTSLTALVPPGIAHAVVVFIGVRFLFGIGEAVLYPASNLLVAKWIPSGERGIANGLIFAGVGAGAGITPPLIAYILTHYGWRWSFWISALIGLAAGLAWYLLARDTPAEHPWVNEGEAEHIAAGLPAPAGKKAGILPWRVIFGSRDVMAIGLSYFTYGYAAWIFFGWFFIYLNNVRGLDMKSSSFYSMLPFIGMAVGSPVGGWISDRLTVRYGPRTGRCGVAVVGIALAAVFIALGTQVAGAQLASIVLAGGAFALYLSQSSFWSVTADIAGDSAGSVSGVMNMFCQIGGALTASLTPLIAKYYGWPASFLTAAGLCALGSVAWLMVNPERKLTRPDLSVSTPVSYSPGR
jgi:ACS family glucarate transporter-like MFS transporter